MVGFMYIIYLGKSAVGGIKQIWKVGRWPKIFGLKYGNNNGCIIGMERLPFHPLDGCFLNNV
jgi:hypothetical protein